MITITGNAKITMGGHDVTKIVTDKDTVSVEGLGCKIEVCEHESDGKPHIKEFNNDGCCSGIGMQNKCKKCGEFYK